MGNTPDSAIFTPYQDSLFPTDPYFPCPKCWSFVGKQDKSMVETPNSVILKTIKLPYSRQTRISNAQTVEELSTIFFQSPLPQLLLMWTLKSDCLPTETYLSQSKCRPIVDEQSKIFLQHSYSSYICLQDSKFSTNPYLQVSKSVGRLSRTAYLGVFLDKPVFEKCQNCWFNVEKCLLFVE